jgi:hypothetical protein
MPLKSSFSLSAALVLCALAFSTPAQSGICEGTVHGLSKTYDLKTGSGFLAVRAQPTSKSPMVHQLFNGDVVEITDRRGNWYLVDGYGFEGWAHRKWIRNSCGY